MEIKILGGGCAKCNKLAQNAKEAIDSLNMDVEITKVTDTIEIIKHGVMSTPALVIDKKIVCSGRLISAKEIVKYISQM